MSTTFTDFNNFIDMWDEICRKNIKEHEQRLFNEMKDKQQIVSPVLICNRETKHVIESALPNMFCIIATEFCEKDKVYMVNDKTLADNIRQSLNWMNRGDKSDDRTD